MLVKLASESAMLSTTESAASLPVSAAEASLSAAECTSVVLRLKSCVIEVVPEAVYNRDTVSITGGKTLGNHRRHLQQIAWRSSLGEQQ